MTSTIEKIFTAGGYDFYRDGEGYWGVAREGEKAPTLCGYRLASSLAKLKNITLPPEWRDA